MLESFYLIYDNGTYNEISYFYKEISISSLDRYYVTDDKESFKIGLEKLSRFKFDKKTNTIEYHNDSIYDTAKIYRYEYYSYYILFEKKHIEPCFSKFLFSVINHKEMVIFEGVQFGVEHYNQKENLKTYSPHQFLGLNIRKNTNREINGC